ncbi:MAG: aldo/keto reductase [Eubacteriales bacterium]
MDLANNYLPPFPAARGDKLRSHPAGEFSAYRDETGHQHQSGLHDAAGPYGDRGSRKYMLASLDQSLKRMGLPYDIFYHHRMDKNTPLEESMMALDTAVKSDARSTRNCRITTGDNAAGSRDPGASCAAGL